MTQQNIKIAGLVRMLDKTIPCEISDDAKNKARVFVDAVITYRDFPFHMKADGYSQNIGWPRDDVRDALVQANPDNAKVKSNAEALTDSFALVVAEDMGKKDQFQEAWQHIQSVRRQR